MKLALDQGFHFEATWLAYALLEDRKAILVAVVKLDALPRLLQVVRIKRVRHALEAPHLVQLNREEFTRLGARGNP